MAIMQQQMQQGGILNSPLARAFSTFMTFGGSKLLAGKTPEVAAEVEPGVPVIRGEELTTGGGGGGFGGLNSSMARKASQLYSGRGF